MRAGSVGNNLAGPASAMGWTQTSQGVGSKFQHIPTVESEWTEFTGVTPKGSQIVRCWGMYSMQQCNLVFENKLLYGEKRRCHFMSL